MTFFLHSVPVRLACLRQELGLSIQNLSALMGVAPETLDAWEKGLEHIPVDAWAALERLRDSTLLRLTDPAASMT